MLKYRRVHDCFSGVKFIFNSIKRRLIGNPLPSALAGHERLTKVRALSVFSSDALSSVAYATEEILLVLVLAGSGFLGTSIPISLAIIALLFIVVVSYRQTIFTYSNGGGAYIVAKENLGEKAGLLAAASILIDYILTVAVSTASGIAAITSAFPNLYPYRIELCLLAILAVTVANLRGINESAKIFMVPTYAFIFSILTMIGVGFFKVSTGDFTAAPPPELPMQHEMTLFLLLRAFSSGCTAMTGVEAVSNGVQSFESPEPKNASIVLIVMSLILGTMFFGITWLSHYHGIVPTDHETVLSQLANGIFGKTGPYYFIQFMTAGILLLAANTSYSGFPTLASILAKDRYVPRQLASLGDKLVFSNGILALGVLSALLIVFFKAKTHSLIPLYAVGVFMSFTLSQAGMVVHWLKEKHGGLTAYRHILINALGCIATAIVTIIFVITKFTQGAWFITILLPAFIVMFRKINRHYLSVGKELSLIGADPSQYKDTVKHTVIIPISGIHKGVLEALKYSRSIASDVRAVYVEIDPATTARLQEDWKKWGQSVALVVLKSPYRSIMEPLLKYIDEVEDMEHDDIVTVIIPEFVTAKWWQNILHNQSALLIRAALAFKRGKVVTSVRYHLGI